MTDAASQPAGTPRGHKPSGGDDAGHSDAGQSSGRVAAPGRIGRRDPSKITFEWTDGVKNEASAAEIRRGCPCAHCVDEHTGKAILDPASVPDGLTQTSVTLVGNYAITVVFSDGHRTGIYTWARLRALAEA